jgi:hypothetical protein
MVETERLMPATVSRANGKRTIGAGAAWLEGAAPAQYIVAMADPEEAA